ncbi:hypothetical protein [Vibrio scophthalmi]|uniref:Uncharacterized protein n=1 Tax=Vibrio scophthalmi LMG 19158 TaxID=870967 RepID=F9RK40_9VIBR|nr:hypothetical protein [Vibrio scophthalmi]EGU40189.1 hypothetical protein VIS19158_15661 [Vibrio scophthalmi LMG 19158]
MICVQVVNDLLQVVPVATGETCQFINLIQQTDFTEQENALTVESVFALIGAAASIYGLTFTINAILIQFGFKR